MARIHLLATLVVFLVGSIVPAQAQCGIGKLAGNWAYVEMGWTVPAGASTTAPVTGIGAFSVDYSGRMTGSGSTISGAAIPGTPIPPGKVLDFDFDGTIEITPDCTGLWKYTVRIKGMPALPGFVERFVYSPQKDEMYSMSIQSPLSKPLWTGFAKRLSNVPGPIAWPPAPVPSGN